MLRESNLLKLLISNEPYNITLFKEVIKIEFNLHPVTCDIIVRQYNDKKDWAEYIYVFNDSTIQCSSKKIILQEGISDANDIICFTK